MPAPITDIHTHAFPDALADRAMEVLTAAAPGVTAHLDGKVSSLIRSMDRAGIGRSVICSIATRPAQFEPIFAWSREIRSDRILPFPSVHPDDPLIVDRIGEIRDAGFRGIKMHPYYQDFSLDEDRLLPFYTAVSSAGLVLVMHTGFDIAFPQTRIADPEKILAVVERFPGLTFVATHLGAWHLWDDVRKYLLGKPIYMEISYSLQYLSPEDAREMILAHPEDYVLFGSDSPWEDQAKALERLRRLDLGSRREEKILTTNADRILTAR
jgi:predicted TIM-barrel fold metal-dependent hydrolase